MSYRVKDKLFLILVIAAAFNVIPKFLQVGFLGGGVLGNKLAFYPVLACFGYSAYLMHKGNWNGPHFRHLCQFLAAYVSVVLISLLIGLWHYPFWDAVFAGPIEQIEKLPRVLEMLQSWGIGASEKLLMGAWIVGRTVKNLFFEILYTFAVSYLVYCWYTKAPQRAVNLVAKGILFVTFPLVLYGLVDLAYLAHQKWAEDILKTVNPYLHEIKSNDTWWPPLLWKGQVRSFFAEPSYVGIWSSFAMPWLWYKLFNARKGIGMLVYGGAVFFLFFLDFMTQARTAVMLLAGESVIFILCLLISFNKSWFLRLGILFCLGALAFGASNFFITNVMTASPKSVVTKNSPNVVTNQKEFKLANAAEKYVKKNVTSLADAKKRSNGARYSMMIADFKVGLEHPALGVGRGLRNAYIPSHFPPMAKGNKEVNMWIKKQKEQGIFKSNMPKLGEYTSRFSETGILGLALFLVPPLFLVLRLTKRILRRGVAGREKLADICFFTSFAGVLASGIGDTLNITYGYWILLGVGYALCFGKKVINGSALEKTSQTADL